MNDSKRGRGRPSVAGATGERYQVTLPKAAAARLRALGSGSLSLGIIKILPSKWGQIQRYIERVQGDAK